MPKAKTNKAAKKRFKQTGTGKLLRKKQGRKHILTKKSSRRKRRLAKSVSVQETFARTYKRKIRGL